MPHPKFGTVIEQFLDNELVLAEKIGADTQSNPEFLCPMTLDVMGDPVIATDRYAYEREALASWMKEKKTNPRTREKIRTNVVSKRVLKTLIDEWKEKREKRQRNYFESAANDAKLKASRAEAALFEVESYVKNLEEEAEEVMKEKAMLRVEVGKLKNTKDKAKEVERARKEAELR